MKRKTILSLLAGMVLVGVTPSCTNLDEEVYDKLPGNDFGGTSIEVNALVGNVHNTLKHYWPDHFLYLSECGGSMAITPTRKGGDWYDGGQYREIYMHTWTAQTTQVKGSWDSATESIGACNATIQLIEHSKALTEAEKTEKLADVRGIRAFWIYTMMDFWGNIPLLTEYSANDKIFPACSPRQVVFDWLLKEVTEIADQCPASTKKNYGSFTQGAAYTLLAKMYLNAAAWNVTYSGNAYQKAIECCDKVMSMGYILEPNWKDNFTTTNDNSREAIFACTFSSSDTDAPGLSRNQMMNRTLHYKDYLALGNTASSTWNGFCAQPDYVKLFDKEDTRYDGSFLTGKQIDKTTGKVIMTDHGFELDHTVDVAILPGTEYDGTAWGAVNQHDGARCIKWNYANDLTDAMENDFHIFRLADVYLMKAEALLRNGGSAADATKLVNEIRERGYGNVTHNYATVDLAKVQLERRLELAWEAWSRQDDIRFDSFTKGLWSASNCPRKTDDFLKIYPISQDAWQVNPKLTQNPGYASFPK